MLTNRLFKILVTLAALAAALMFTGCSAVEQMTGTDQIAGVAEQIAGYEVPEGYSEQFAVDMLGYQLVSMEGPTPNCHLYLVQAPENARDDMESLKKQAEKMENTRIRSRRGKSEIKIVETRAATIRGQETTLSVGEGTNSEGEPYREVTAVFEGKNGPALVSISSPVALWDWDLVDAFLASLN